MCKKWFSILSNLTYNTIKYLIGTFLLGFGELIPDTPFMY